jgi:hypothetical protein
MARVVSAELQTIWDCRWSRPGYGVIGTPLHPHQERLWICVRRPHAERVITEEDCETCSHWRAETDAGRRRNPVRRGPRRCSTSRRERDTVN